MTRDVHDRGTAGAGVRRHPAPSSRESSGGGSLMTCYLGLRTVTVAVAEVEFPARSVTL